MMVHDLLLVRTSILRIIVACMVAASIPALRAARIDPIAALREE